MKKVKEINNIAERDILRDLYLLLDELDPDHNWCRLKPWTTESHHTIWLCPKRLKEKNR